MEFTKTRAKVIIAWKQKRNGFITYAQKPKLENER